MADKLKQIMYIRVVLSTAAAGKSFGRNVCVFVRARAMLYRSGIQAREDEEESVHGNRTEKSIVSTTAA